MATATKKAAPKAAAKKAASKRATNAKAGAKKAAGAKKGAAAKKATKKGATKKAAPKKERGPRLFWTDQRVKLLQALKKSKAVSVITGLTWEQIAKKSGLSEWQIKEMVWHKNPRSLNVSGHLTQGRQEEGRNVYYYLTAKGQKCDPVAEQKKEKEKAGK